MELDAVMRIIADIKARYAREMRQKLLQDQLRDAQFALGGEMGLERLERELILLEEAQRARDRARHAGKAAADD